jgi:hypothetical protein
MKKLRRIKSMTATVIALAASAATAFGAAPANDNFANAEQLNGIRVAVTRTNVDATKEAGEFDHGNNPGGKSVWFKWTAPMGRMMVFTTTRTVAEFDSLLGLYMINAGELVRINGNDDIRDENARSRMYMDVEAGRTYYIAVDGAARGGEPAAADSFLLDIRPFFPFQTGDSDNDSISDLVVFRPSTGTWYAHGSTIDREQPWGMTGDIPLPGHLSFGTGDVPVFRPSTGMWYFNGGCCEPDIALAWGTAGDIPLIEDLNGPFSASATVFRPSDGTWYVKGLNPVSPNLYFHFGQNGDIPVPAHYTNDTIADVAVFRPSDGVWYIRERRTYLPEQDTYRSIPFGQAGDKPVPADYDGDGLVDIAVYRPSTGTWWILQSSDNQPHAYQWGLPDDAPVTGDFDGDGLFDLAVFRRSNGYWYIYHLGTQTIRSKRWGIAEDVPVTSNQRY